MGEGGVVDSFQDHSFDALRLHGLTWGSVFVQVGTRLSIPARWDCIPVRFSSLLGSPKGSRTTPWRTVVALNGAPLLAPQAFFSPVISACSLLLLVFFLATASFETYRNHSNCHGLASSTAFQASLGGRAQSSNTISSLPLPLNLPL